VPFHSPKSRGCCNQFELFDYFGGHKLIHMKSIRFFVLPFLLLLWANSLQADVATEGEHDVYIELLNGKDFPGYKFYIKFQDYYYNMGYQPGDVSVVYLEPGKHVSTGDRGSSSLLFAEGKSNAQTKTEVGGADIDHTEGLSYFLDRIKIKSIKKKVINFEVVERQLIGEDGKVLQTIKKGSLPAMNGTQLVIWIIPIVCLVGLMVFFLFRRKASQA
jgi:hypothetical protein